MKVLIIRKSRKKKKAEQVAVKDFEFEIVYTKTLKRARKIIKKRPRDFAVSYDFQNLTPKCESVMYFFPKEALYKICARHAVDLYEKAVGVFVENLNEKTSEILTEIALNVRFMTIYSPVLPQKFDFLGIEAGLTPRVENSSDFKEEITIFLGEEFLIKEAKSGKTYYDIKLKWQDEFYEKGIYEIGIVLAKFLEQNNDFLKNVKIKELMSK